MSEFIPDHIKAVMFDFDDTLVGTHQAIWNLHRHIARTFYGLELDDDTLLKHWGQPIPVLAQHYYKASDVDAAVELIQQQTVDFPKETFPHTIATLRRLKMAGMVLGIVSATRLPILNMDVKNAEIPMEIIDYVQTAEDTDTHKPDPRVFDPMLAWAVERNITPDQILYVGDGLQDMLAATDAGMNFVAVTTGLITSDEFIAAGAKSVPDLSYL